ncbi:MAG: DUF4188 domain-containing protein [Actinomycetales bacterium]
MTAMNLGRYTVSGSDDVTVFLIGMRVRKPWRVDQWVPVARAFTRMLAYLERTPEAGLLGHEEWFGRTTLMLSYWRSPEHLQRFAADPDAPHAEPWRIFMRSVGADPVVGVWHETYRATPGNYEVVYLDMPDFGLGKAVGVQRVGAGSSTARQRLRRAGRLDTTPKRSEATQS